MGDDTQLMTVAPSAIAAREAEKPSMLQAVMAAAMNPDLDPERIKAFLDMAREMDQDEKRQQFYAAFAAAKAQISAFRIMKNGEIVYPGKNGGPASVVKFIKHDDINRAVTPILAEHGLTTTYSSEILATAPKVVTVMTVIHHNGYSREWRSIPMPLVDSGGGKNDVQGAGSISTYGRRFVTVAAFDIVAEDSDDDGNLGKAAQPITQDQADTIADILHEIEQRQKGSTAQFSRWIKQQFKVDAVGQLLQGDQHAEVMEKLDKKQREMGIKR